MNISKILRSSLIAALVTGFSTFAHAQATRTWVSGVGDDANPCSRTAPCKTFAGAISKTAPCGEISVLDPGGFGAVTITKAMTINGTGTLAGILSALANAAVIVNATANDTVVLRQISMNGACSGVNGVRFIGGKTLVIDHCWIGNMTTRGIDVAKTADLTQLKVFGTDITNVATGIGASTTVGKVVVDVTDITIQQTTNGVQYLTNAQGSVTNCFFAKNTGEAIGVGATCVVNVTHCHFRGNNIGVSAAAGAAVRVNENELFDNNNGFQGTAASFQSGGNNKLAGNTASVTPTGPALLNQ